MSDADTDRPLQRRKRTLLAAEARRAARQQDQASQTPEAKLKALIRRQQPQEPVRRTCGARTRRGTPCRALGLANGRCRNHGGLSTGPRTAEGKAKAAEALRRYRERVKAARRTLVE